ncbi:hypothetical protein M011DRAFT_25079 [Sporormia fimetaria CBS 119925]|uniref:Uncharacterized protein n=1 Tax=Sporormia fimetaria CBS 119925 TaxID=1340428 RepID=A0A6A6VCR2_9PLEO|nr:hypothetical protein M011DRAFT_25079 [Sporormia fimetaria CBS 119925]
MTSNRPYLSHVRSVGRVYPVTQYQPPQSKPGYHGVGTADGLTVVQSAASTLRATYTRYLTLQGCNSLVCMLVSDNGQPRLRQVRGQSERKFATVAILASYRCGPSAHVTQIFTMDSCTALGTAHRRAKSLVRRIRLTCTTVAHPALRCQIMLMCFQPLFDPGFAPLWYQNPGHYQNACSVPCCTSPQQLVLVSDSPYVLPFALDLKD